MAQQHRSHHYHHEELHKRKKAHKVQSKKEHQKVLTSPAVEAPSAEQTTVEQGEEIITPTVSHRGHKRKKGHRHHKHKSTNKAVERMSPTAPLSEEVSLSTVQPSLLLQQQAEEHQEDPTPGEQPPNSGQPEGNDKVIEMSTSEKHLEGVVENVTEDNTSETGNQDVISNICTAETLTQPEPLAPDSQLDKAEVGPYHESLGTCLQNAEVQTPLSPEDEVKQDSELHIGKGDSETDNLQGSTFGKISSIASLTESTMTLVDSKEDTSASHGSLISEGQWLSESETKVVSHLHGQTTGEEKCAFGEETTAKVYIDPSTVSVHSIISMQDIPEQLTMSSSKKTRFKKAKRSKETKKELRSGEIKREKKHKKDKRSGTEINLEVQEIDIEVSQMTSNENTKVINGSQDEELSAKPATPETEVCQGPEPVAGAEEPSIGTEKAEGPTGRIQLSLDSEEPQEMAVDPIQEVESDSIVVEAITKEGVSEPMDEDLTRQETSPEMHIVEELNRHKYSDEPIDVDEPKDQDFFSEEPGRHEPSGEPEITESSGEGTSNETLSVEEPKRQEDSSGVQPAQDQPQQQSQLTLLEQPIGLIKLVEVDACDRSQAEFNAQSNETTAATEGLPAHETQVSEAEVIKQTCVTEAVGEDSIIVKDKKMKKWHLHAQHANERPLDGSNPNLKKTEHTVVKGKHDSVSKSRHRKVHKKFQPLHSTSTKPTAKNTESLPQLNITPTEEAPLVSDKVGEAGKENDPKDSCNGTVPSAHLEGICTVAEGKSSLDSAQESATGMVEHSYHKDPNLEKLDQIQKDKELKKVYHHHNHHQQHPKDREHHKSKHKHSHHKNSVGTNSGSSSHSTGSHRSGSADSQKVKKSSSSSKDSHSHHTAGSSSSGRTNKDVGRIGGGSGQPSGGDVQEMLVSVSSDQTLVKNVEGAPTQASYGGATPISIKVEDQQRKETPSSMSSPSLSKPQTPVKHHSSYNTSSSNHSTPFKHLHSSSSSSASKHQSSKHSSSSSSRSGTPAKHDSKTLHEHSSSSSKSSEAAQTPNKSKSEGSSVRSSSTKKRKHDDQSSDSHALKKLKMESDPSTPKKSHSSSGSTHSTPSKHRSSVHKHTPKKEGKLHSSSHSSSKRLRFSTDAEHQVRKTVLSRANFKYGHLIHIETHPNGGAQVLHAYVEELSHLDKDQLQEFSRDFFNYAFNEDTVGKARFVMGIIHGSAAYLPDMIEYFGENHPNMVIKMGVMGKPEVDTMVMAAFRELVNKTYSHGTYRAGPLLQVCGSRFTYKTWVCMLRRSGMTVSALSVLANFWPTYWIFSVVFVRPYISVDSVGRGDYFVKTYSLQLLGMA